MQTKLTVQKRLKDLRVVDLGLTLEELAERTGLSRSALGKYESDETAKDLNGILRDIREVHRKDVTTADEGSVVLDVRKEVEAVASFKGSHQEKQARIFLANLGVDYDALTMEQFVNLIEILKLSKYAESPFSQRGKSSMTHGKSKTKKKKRK